MYPLDFIADALDTNGSDIDFDVDFDKYDLNSDGDITADDCPFPPGSAEAKLWWRNIMEPYAKSQLTDELRAEHGNAVVGVYKGKPLVPSSNASGTGDFQFLVDKIRYTHGLSYSSSVKIAGKIKYMHGA
jgi:hypothetical protein